MSLEKKEGQSQALTKEVASMTTQIEVLHSHLTGQKQQNECLKAELSQVKQKLAEVSQSDLAKKTMLLQTELE